MRLNHFLSAILILLTTTTFSQISFTNNSSALENQMLSSGFAMGISDMNGDGLDDIIRFSGATQLEYEHQQADGSFQAFNVGAILGSEVWSVCVGDVDGNGINDMLHGGFAESPLLLKTVGPLDYEMDLLDVIPFFMQGSNLADIDNDGILDYFACDDNNKSKVFKGDGSSLAVSDDLIDPVAYMQSGGSSNAGNYASTWIDYDNDEDLDLYISKCFLAAGGDPLNPARVNLMYRNDGGGVFTEVAEEIGLRPFGQTWSSEFGDIDNDGDLDVLVLNHDINSMLYLNDGNGNFTDISAAAGVVLTPNTFPSAMQVYMQDFDNDRYLDILVTSFSSNTIPKLYHNNGDNTFTEVNAPWGSDVNVATGNQMQSAAMGDLNNDGFVDMIVGFAAGLNFPNGSFPDRLYTGNNNGNNWLKLNLQGIQSNSNAIGARIKICGPWGCQIREVRSGSGYGIMNSLTTMFGLGDSDEVSTVEITWPSGNETIINNPQANTCLEVVESSLNVGQATAFICEGEDILLGGALQTTAGIYADTINMDSVLLTTLVVNDVFNIQANPLNACFGATVGFGDETLTAPGDYVFNYDSQFGCDSTVNVTLNWYEEIVFNGDVVDDTGAGDGSITLDIQGAADPFDIFWSTGDMNVTTVSGIASGTIVLVELVDANDCTHSEEFTVGLSSLFDLNEQGINVFPNPTLGNLFINNEGGKATKLQIYNTLGQRVHDAPISIGMNDIDMGQFSAGVYIIRLLNNENNSLGTMQIAKK